MRTPPLLLIFTTNAELIVAKPDTASFQEITRDEVADSPTWAHPASSGRQIVIKDADFLTAWAVPGPGDSQQSR